MALRTAVPAVDSSRDKGGSTVISVSTACNSSLNAASCNSTSKAPRQQHMEAVGANDAADISIC